MTIFTINYPEEPTSTDNKQINIDVTIADKTIRINTITLIDKTATGNTDAFIGPLHTYANAKQYNATALQETTKFAFLSTCVACTGLDAGTSKQLEFSFGPSKENNLFVNEDDIDNFSDKQITVSIGLLINITLTISYTNGGAISTAISVNTTCVPQINLTSGLINNDNDIVTSITTQQVQNVFNNNLKISLNIGTSDITFADFIKGTWNWGSTTLDIKKNNFSRNDFLDIFKAYSIKFNYITISVNSSHCASLFTLDNVNTALAASIPCNIIENNNMVSFTVHESPLTNLSLPFNNQTLLNLMLQDSNLNLTIVVNVQLEGSPKIPNKRDHMLRICQDCTEGIVINLNRLAAMLKVIITLLTLIVTITLFMITRQLQ